MTSYEARRRVVIEGVDPQIDGGRFPIKRTVGETVRVEADVFADGHDAVSCMLLYRNEGDPVWRETQMKPLVNDRWRGEFTVSEIGSYQYSLEGWMDPFRTWRRDLAKRVEAGQDVSVDLLIGAQMIQQTANRAASMDAARLCAWAADLQREISGIERRQTLAMNEELAQLAHLYPDREFATRYSHELRVTVDREAARFSAWYEMFPRSCGTTIGSHGTFRDCEAWLGYVAEMGFNVLYFPPIHPIGRAFRKGKNNTIAAGPGDVGSPWAIGAEEGGHTSIHPCLGTLEDFEHLAGKAGERGIEIALDLAFQCAPDHPWVKDHPEWFRRRPDGTIQYAENPPKKYQDIYPLDFESDNWRELWTELKEVVLFWTERGVRIFRVDNPHTKTFPFWEWLIREVKTRFPDVIFLSEAFTRPKIMYHLAKLGFTQSYTYFSWRNTKRELTDYFTELAGTGVREYFRPNLWPNTPDILPEYLQTGGRPAFMSRLVLAATLGASYGIYGPAFELCENQPREPGSEEYLNSEKYVIKHCDADAPSSLKDLIGRVNQIRRENPALQSDHSLRFHPVDNEALICYSKATPDLENVIVVVVNLDFRYTHSGWVYLDLQLLGLQDTDAYEVHDLLTGNRYGWRGNRNYVELNPRTLPAHVFRIGRKLA